MALIRRRLLSQHQQLSIQAQRSSHLGNEMFFHDVGVDIPREL